jgi:DNA processing protein
LDNLPQAPAAHEARLRRLKPEELPFGADRPDAPGPPEARRQVLALLSPEPTMVDDLVRRCQLSPPVTVAVLLELELSGRVETLPGNRVALLPGGTD